MRGWYKKAKALLMSVARLREPQQFCVHQDRAFFQFSVNDTRAVSQLFLFLYAVRLSLNGLLSNLVLDCLLSNFCWLILIEWLIDWLIDWLIAGADPGFSLGGGALVSFSTSTPINHIVFLQNTSCIRKPQGISGRGGGCAPPAPSPRSAPGLID